MSYQPNIPLPNDQLSVSQQDIEDNFQEIQTYLHVNHVMFNSPDQGKHLQVNFTRQALNPAVSGNDVIMYAKLSTVSNESELFLRMQNGDVVDFTSCNQTSPGWTRLPSGILIKWGTVSVTRNTLNTVIFPATSATVPGFTGIFSVTGSQTFNAGPSAGDLNTASIFGAITTSSFQVYPRAIGLPNSGSVSVSYVAIGV